MCRTSAVTEPGQSADRRVVLAANLASALVHYLVLAGEHERGGVLLGRRVRDTTVVAMAVFPPQLQRERIACSFDVGCLDVLNAAKARLGDDLTTEMGTIVGWVHSHPRLGVFLSRTDVETLTAWLQLDPQAIAVVADPYLAGDVNRRIAWWGGPGRGRRVALDYSGRGHLTISQVAKVAEALNDNASMNSQWDIVTAQMVASIVAAPPIGADVDDPSEEPGGDSGNGPDEGP